MTSLILLAALSTAQGATTEQVEARLAEIEELREIRLSNAAPPFDHADIDRAVEGSVVTQLTSTWNWGITLMRQPISKLWAGLNDETRHPGYTAVTYSELLQGSTCHSGRRVLQYLPVPIPFVADRWWIGILRDNRDLYRASGGSVRELSWTSSTDASEITSAAGQKMIQKAQPIGHTRGAWLLVAIDERTTWVEYHQVSDPGQGIPSNTAARLAARGIRETFAAQERFAREGSPSCPVH